MHLLHRRRVDGRLLGDRRGLAHRDLGVGGVVARAHHTNASSPTAATAMNSWFTSPPISPASPSTGRKVRPQRVKTRVYASNISWYVALEPVEVEVERVRVLHQELAPAQQAEAGTQLVAVLPVDLVEVHRQVAVARVLVGDGRRDDLLRGRRQAEPGLLAVLEPEQLRAVGLVAPGALPELERLHDRQPQLLGAGGVHLLPHDLLDPAQHPVPERQPRVDAARDPADVAGAHEQAVAVDLGVGGVVAQRAEEEPRHPHGWNLRAAAATSGSISRSPQPPTGLDNS